MLDEKSCSNQRHICVDIIVSRVQIVEYSNPKLTAYAFFRKDLHCYLGRAVESINDRQSLKIAAEKLEEALMTTYVRRELHQAGEDFRQKYSLMEKGANQKEGSSKKTFHPSKYNLGS